MGSGNDPNALLLHGRLTAGGMEDLLVLTRGQYIEVAHPIAADSSLKTTPAYVTIDSTPTPVVAAVATRMSTDSRLGVVTTDGTLHPLASLPTTRTRYYVNITSDAYHSPANCTTSTNANCSLRDALAATNAARQTGTPNSVDYIYVAASTTLATQNNYADQQGDYNYHFTIETSVNITGVGTCTPRTSFPTSAAASCPIVLDGANKDLLFNINTSSTDINGSTFHPYAVFFSNLQMQNAINNNNVNGNSSGPYGAILGGMIFDDVDGPGSLTMNNVVMKSGTVTYGYNGDAGGALGIFNSGAGSTAGSVELDNSTFSNNYGTFVSTAGGDTGNGTGGAMALSDDITLTANSDAWLTNTATGYGGAIYYNGSSFANSSTITGNLFSGNTGESEGGGLYYPGQITISNTVFSTNALTGTYAAAFTGGGGVYAFAQNGPVSITYSTFTGNTISYTGGDGAGLTFQGTSGSTYPMSLTYSRIHGNTGGIAGTQGLANEIAADGGTGTTVVTATNNWWGCNTDPQTTGTACDHVHVYAAGGTVTTSPFTTLAVNLNSTTPAANSTVTATASLGQDNTGTMSGFGAYTTTQDQGYVGVPATIVFTKGDNSTSTGTGTLNTAAQYAYGLTANVAGTGHATATVDGFAVTSSNYTVQASDLIVFSSHTGNFQAGDSADTYTLSVDNTGNISSGGTVTLTDNLPTGFTAVSAAGNGWSCSVAASAPQMTCTRSDSIGASNGYPAVTLTVSIASNVAGSFFNGATVTNAASLPNTNSTIDSTIVVGPPTITEAFSPTTVGPNVNSTVTFTVGNPGANTVSLMGVSFTDPLPSGLKLTGSASSNCTGATTGGSAGGTIITLTGATISAGATCVVTATVASTSAGSYPNPSGNVTATNSNAGGTATATLTVAVTPTRLVFTSVPPPTITAGGNAGTVQVALEDGSGNVATSNSGTSVTLSVTGPNGYSQPYSTTTSNGVASVNLSSVSLTAAGAYTYTATASGYTQATASETVNAGALAALTVNGYPNPTSVQLAGNVTVTASDSYGNPVSSFTGTVTITTSDPAATISPVSYTYTASDAGSHVFSVTFNTAGNQTITAISGSSSGSKSNITVNDAIWVLSATGQRSEITETGSGLMLGLGGATASSPYGAIAIDNAGVVWSVTSGTNNLQSTTYTGTVNGFNGGGLSAPVAVAIDGLGYIWIANAASYTASEFSPSGVALSPAAGFSTTAGTSTTVTSPVGIAIDISGSVWTVDATTNTLTRILGAAAPVVSPIAAGVANKTQGTLP